MSVEVYRRDLSEANVSVVCALPALEEIGAQVVTGRVCYLAFYTVFIQPLLAHY